MGSQSGKNVEIARSRLKEAEAHAVSEARQAILQLRRFIHSVEGKVGPGYEDGEPPDLYFTNYPLQNDRLIERWITLTHAVQNFHNQTTETPNYDLFTVRKRKVKRKKEWCSWYDGEWRFVEGGELCGD